MHIGIIPDGNRRWASEHGTTITEAYSVGFCNVIDITLRLSSYGCDQITFFGLSNDNYTKRPKNQIDEILTYIIDATLASAPLLRNHGICARFFGNIEELENEHQVNLKAIQQATEASVPISNLNILINYKPDWDLKRERGFLHTGEIPPCDIVFRSGRMARLSGFLPLQSANASLYFSPTLWPDIKPDEIFKALRKMREQKQNRGA